MRAGRCAAALLLLLLSSAGRAIGSEDIVVGCGGFVKSDVEINYSLIEVSCRAWPGGLCDPGPGSRLLCTLPQPRRGAGGREGLPDPGSSHTRTSETLICPNHIAELGNHTRHSPYSKPQGSDSSLLHPPWDAFKEDRFPLLSPDMEQCNNLWGCEAASPSPPLLFKVARHLA